MKLTSTTIAAGLLAASTLLLTGCAGTGKKPPPSLKVVQHEDQGHLHVPNPLFPHEPYNSNPPTSGPHTPYIADWGVHKKPVPNEVLVHNLEHGGIVIGYTCTNCPETVVILEELTREYEMVIIAPNPDLDTPIALSAWQHSLAVPALDIPGRNAIAAFFKRFHGIDHHPPTRHPHSAPPEQDNPEQD